jgi:hypothetical protein
VTTGTPGNLLFNSRTSSAVILAAREHPAFSDGISTFFVGFRIFAVSAMNFTPQNTMMSLSVSAALRLSSSESPTKSGIEWKSAGSM